jgi:hypothetical protein
MEKLPTSNLLKTSKVFHWQKSTEFFKLKTDVIRFFQLQWLSYFYKHLPEVDIVLFCVFASRYLALMIILLYLWSSIHAITQ